MKEAFIKTLAVTASAIFCMILIEVMAIIAVALLRLFLYLGGGL